jgi:UDP-sulfoquinovose synthase
MQGVVYGIGAPVALGDERLHTRLDFDAVFGTVINRFCCSAVIGTPLTLYGHGGQKRGFLSLQDSIQCLTLILENPPAPGEYRIVNQFQEVYGIRELADLTCIAAESLGIETTVKNLDNPRIEQEDHYYHPDHETLSRLGYRPSSDIASELRIMLKELIRYRERIEAKREALRPTICWSPSRMFSPGI